MHFDDVLVLQLVQNGRFFLHVCVHLINNLVELINTITDTLLMRKSVLTATILGSPKLESSTVADDSSSV